MSGVNLLLGVHNHQPVGNFLHVFEESFEMCYRPQIDVLKNYPDVKMALHHSGPLFEWIEKNRPEYIDDLGEMSQSGQIELLGGGFYEPILSSLPVDDAIGQLVMMNEYLQKRFGKSPTGMWTAERIWDTSLPTLAKAAGISYTLLDDTHFYYAGLSADDMFGYYITEMHGDTLAIFPIDKNLRYSIPFKMPHENIAYLRSLRDKGVECVTYGDDGEKFGVWPETHKWVYEEKWLNNFYSALSESPDIVKTVLFSEFLENHPARGRTYIPLASYEEMMGWSLSPESGAKFHHVLKDLEASGKKEEWKPFIRGGLWNNFLAKYDESNRMHKKMLHVSRKIASAKNSSPSTVINEATKELYRGQCNCSYWHGLFGGLYLNYLRHAVLESLIKAETIIDKFTHEGGAWLLVDRYDYDCDGGDDIVVTNPVISFVIDPNYGGTILEFDYKPASFCITNTLTRRPEAYHELIRNHKKSDDNQETQPASIHDIVRMKEDDLHESLFYDKANRRTFGDHFFGADISPKDFADSRYDELGDFLDGRYTIAGLIERNGRASVKLRRNGVVTIGDAKHLVAVEKTFLANSSNGSVEVHYRITNTGAETLLCNFGVELNLTLLAGDADDRYWTGNGFDNRPPLKNAGVSHGSIGMRDDWAGFETKVSTLPETTIWRYPVETVSQSESGFERIYQGSALALIYPLKLGAGKASQFTVTLEAYKIDNLST